MTAPPPLRGLAARRDQRRAGEGGRAWAVYGTSSGFHLFMNPHGRPLDRARFDPHDAGLAELKEQPAA